MPLSTQNTPPSNSALSSADFLFLIMLIKLTEWDKTGRTFAVYSRCISGPNQVSYIGTGEHRCWQVWVQTNIGAGEVLILFIGKKAVQQDVFLATAIRKCAGEISKT